MTKILDWTRAEDPRDVIHLAVQALAEGHLVAFPTEHHYLIAASGLRRRAIERLAAAMGAQASDGAPWGSLMARSPDEIYDYAPSASLISRRLVQRAWPGPLVLEIPDGHTESLATQLEPATSHAVRRESGELWLSSPHHEVLQQVARLTAGPLVLSQPRGSDGRQALGIASELPADVALVIDGGAIPNPASVSIVRVEGTRCRLVQPGALPSDKLAQLTRFVVLMVCTGNTCRSPMAEALMKRRLEERFQQTVPPGATALDASPVSVLSAGVAAAPGDPASDGALAAMRSLGLDVRSHQSRALSQTLIDRSDLILTMTDNHRQTILSRWPHAAAKIAKLDPTGGDVADPYGGPVEMYRATAQSIDRFVVDWLARIGQDQLANWQVNGDSL